MGWVGLCVFCLGLVVSLLDRLRGGYLLDERVEVGV